MTHNDKRPAQVAGRSVVDCFAGNDQPSATTRSNQASCPLFNPRTRADALHTAQELNAAAARCRTEARSHPGSTGLTLDRLASHYAGMARAWFARADGFPREARA